MITEDFVSAITKELMEFFSDKNGTVILNAELGHDFAFSAPLCVIEVEDAPESARLPGGATRYELNFSIKIYPFEPNAYNSSDQGYSAALLEIVEQVRWQIENEVWITSEMIELTTNYAFRITYNGTTRAEPLETEAGLCMGFRHGFMTIAYEMDTVSQTTITSTGGTISGTEIVK